MEQNFFGWIPCISGELFFKHIELDHAKYDKFLANYTFSNQNKYTRRAIFSSCLDTQDNNYLPIFTRGESRIIVISKAKESSMSGYLYYHRKVKTKYDPEGVNLKKFDKKIFDHLNNFQNTYNYISEHQSHNQEISSNIPLDHIQKDKKINPQDLLEIYIKKIEEELENNLDSKLIIFKIKFEIDRTGFINLSIDSDRSQEEISRIIDESYLYLKFALHKHKHHHESTDLIIKPHIYRNGDDIYSNLDILLRDLKRSLVELKRSENYKDYESAIGIAHYADSMILSFHKYIENHPSITPEKIKTLHANHKDFLYRERGYFENIIKSLKILIKIKSENALDTLHDIILIKYPEFTIAFITLSIESHASTNIRGDGSGKKVNLAQYFQDHELNIENLVYVIGNLKKVSPSLYEHFVLFGYAIVIGISFSLVYSFFSKKDSTLIKWLKTAFTVFPLRLLNKKYLNANAYSYCKPRTKRKYIYPHHKETHKFRELFYLIYSFFRCFLEKYCYFINKLIYQSEKTVESAPNKNWLYDFNEKLLFIPINRISQYSDKILGIVLGVIMAGSGYALFQNILDLYNLINR